MSDKEKLIEKINEFYFDISEDYKEITLKIKDESSPLNIFRKKDYRGNTEALKKCKAQALGIDLRTVKTDSDDSEGAEMKEKFQKVLTSFNALCDAQIQLQIALMKKAEKSGGRFSECSEIMKKVNTSNTKLQKAINELDIQYADYNEG